MLVEFGRPIEVTEDLVKLYSSNKREACAKLLENVRVGLRNVTINCPDFKTLQTILLARRLYQPSTVE